MVCLKRSVALSGQKLEKAESVGNMKITTPSAMIQSDEANITTNDPMRLNSSQYLKLHRNMYF